MIPNGKWRKKEFFHCLWRKKEKYAPFLLKCNNNEILKVL